jgi:ketosteroid isomerase-like protein
LPKLIDAWNSHDLDVILSHYSEDIEITTPMIKMALGEGDGSLKGKDAVADYWRRALDKMQICISCFMM